MAGWIKLHRKILQSDFYRNLTGRQRDVIITLLLMADHEPREWKYKGKTYRTEPGQVFTSFEKIRKKCGKDCTRETVRATILNAENNHFITRDSHRTHTLITIENWGIYQLENINQTQSALTTDTVQTRVTTTNKKKEYIYSVDTPEYRLCKLLFALMRDNNPNCKQPNIQSWCKDMNKIIRIDQREPEDIAEVIKWSQKDEFWKSNILSPSKLRKQYDQLKVKMPTNKKVVEFSKKKEFGNGWDYI
ncbi:hypothetical protein [Peptostreptococcus russellii]|uniref:hypothetical protein n=1 Tax=Peptostreptococcus russellii TaxID=215200 RepID=UPI003F5897F9